jgi:hypothetical protein
MCTLRPTAVTAADGVAPWFTLVASERPALPAVADAVRNAQAATPPPRTTKTTRSVISRRRFRQRLRGPPDRGETGAPPPAIGDSGGGTITLGPAGLWGAITDAAARVKT